METELSEVNLTGNLEDHTITFNLTNKEVMKFVGTGDIFVRGVLCTNDMEIVHAADEFFRLAKTEVTELIAKRAVENYKSLQKEMRKAARHKFKPTKKKPVRTSSKLQKVQAQLKKLVKRKKKSAKSRKP